MSRSKTPRIIGVEPGDPHNDQMLARVREDLRDILDSTIHPLIDQKEEKGADLSVVMAALVMSWLMDEDYMPRDRLASNLGLALFMLAEQERNPLMAINTDEDPV